MEVDSKPISDESINSILQYLPYFSENNTFGEWKGGDENEDGVKTFPYLTYSDEVNQFVKLLYETNFIVSFDWSKWDEGRKIISDKNLIQKSDLLTLRMLITSVVRNDRFCEGSLLSSIEDKTILTILQRLDSLKDKIKMEDKSGIYIVTLNNDNLISVNPNDEKSIKVNKSFYKVGKSNDLEKMRKKLYKTFGEENVNFEVLGITYSIESILISIQIKLGRGKSGWLENTSVRNVLNKISEVFDEYENHMLINYIQKKRHLIIQNLTKDTSNKRNKKQIITSQSVIDKFFELLNLSPNIEEWSENRFSENEPRLYRYLQLISLLKSYNLPLDIKEFLSGNFIDGYDEKYKSLLELMTKENHTELAPQNPIEGNNLGDSFRILFRYRIKINEVVSYSNGVLAASDEYRFMYNKIGNFNKLITENLSEIDSILSQIISPQQKTFTLEEMESNFNYPNVDLFEIDMEYF